MQSKRDIINVGEVHKAAIAAIAQEFENAKEEKRKPVVEIARYVYGWESGTDTDSFILYQLISRMDERHSYYTARNGIPDGRGLDVERCPFYIVSLGAECRLPPNPPYPTLPARNRLTDWHQQCINSITTGDRIAIWWPMEENYIATTVFAVTRWGDEPSFSLHYIKNDENLEFDLSRQPILFY